MIGHENGFHDFDVVSLFSSRLNQRHGAVVEERENNTTRNQLKRASIRGQIPITKCDPSSLLPIRFPSPRLDKRSYPNESLTICHRTGREWEWQA